MLLHLHFLLLSPHHNPSKNIESLKDKSNCSIYPMKNNCGHSCLVIIKIE